MSKLQLRRDTSANFTTANTLLASGEPARETDTGRRKTGDGTNAWTSLHHDFDNVHLSVFPVAFYKTGGQLDATGATDESTAANATLAAMYAAGGGIMQFPSGTIRWDNVVIPNSGGDATHAALQPTYVIRGAGCIWDSQLNTGLPTGTGAGTATILDLRSTTGPAKIATYGKGLLIFEDITLTQKGSASDTNPFVYTTNTAVRVKPGTVSVYGHATLSQAACVQDAFVFGGDGTALTVGNAVNAPFQGYGSAIVGVLFGRIRRCAWLRAWANSITVKDNIVANTCGSDNTAAAFHMDGSGAGSFSRGNIVCDNLIEVGGYVYGVRFTNAGGNKATGNQFWDPTGSFLAAYLLEGTSGTAVTGNKLGGLFTGIPAAQWVVDSTTNAAYTLEAGHQHSGANTGFYVGKTLIAQPAIATGSEATALFQINRSSAEATNPGQTAASVTQAGKLTLGGTAWSTTAGINIQNTAGTLTVDHTSLVKAAGQLDLYPGTGTNDMVRIMRGTLKLPPVTTAARASASGTGAGAQAFDSTLGKPIWSNGTAWVDATGATV